MATGDKTFIELLLEGVADYLATNTGASVPVVWKPSGDYSATERGIYVISAPVAGERPLTLTLRPYYSLSDPSLSDDVVSFQIDFYGPKRDVVRSVDDTFDRLQGAWGLVLGGVKVQQVSRTSGAILGLDEGINHRQTENYDLAVHRPSSHRQ